MRTETPLPATAAVAAAPAVRLGPVRPEQADRRIETALMVTFRDTRTEEAFTALYERARSSLLGWIVHLLSMQGQESDPLELLQDTFVNVYRYAGGFRDEAGHSFRGWARTIAANVVRRARSRRNLLSYQDLPRGLDEPADERAGPERTAVTVEQRTQLGRAWILLLLHYAAAFEKLSPRDQRALAMIEVEGLAYAEAGRRLRVGSSNMKMIMFRSRKRIRAHILAAMTGEREESLLRVAG